jgi:hypothetical protein
MNMRKFAAGIIGGALLLILVTGSVLLADGFGFGSQSNFGTTDESHTFQSPETEPSEQTSYFIHEQGLKLILLGLFSVLAMGIIVFRKYKLRLWLLFASVIVLGFVMGGFLCPVTAVQNIFLKANTGYLLLFLAEHLPQGEHWIPVTLSGPGGPRVGHGTPLLRVYLPVRGGTGASPHTQVGNQDPFPMDECTIQAEVCSARLRDRARTSHRNRDLAGLLPIQTTLLLGRDTAGDRSHRSLRPPIYLPLSPILPDPLSTRGVPLASVAVLDLSYSCKHELRQLQPVHEGVSKRRD